MTSNKKKVGEGIVELTVEPNTDGCQEGVWDPAARSDAPDAAMRPDYYRLGLRTSAGAQSYFVKGKYNHEG